MKTLAAFLLGVAAAGGTAYFLVRGSDSSEEQGGQAASVEPAVRGDTAKDVEPSGTSVEPSPALPASSQAALRQRSDYREAGSVRGRLSSPARPPVQEQEEPIGAAPAPQPPPVLAPLPVDEPESVEPPRRGAVDEPSTAKPPEPPAPPRTPRTVTIAGGTLISVRLAEKVSSETHKEGDAFLATLDQPLVVNELVIAERGARAEGRIVASEEAGRVKGVSSIALELLTVTTSDGQRIELKTQSFAKEGPKTVAQDAAKVGAAAGIGAAIGAIIGGGKGAGIGAAAGGAAGTGTVMATRGKAAELPAETRISFRVNEPVEVVEKLK
jgi:hypothetical protein